MAAITKLLVLHQRIGDKDNGTTAIVDKIAAFNICPVRGRAKRAFGNGSSSLINPLNQIYIFNSTTPQFLTRQVRVIRFRHMLNIILSNRHLCANFKLIKRKQIYANKL